MSKQNPSGVSPRGAGVLVEYYEPERKASVIFIPESVRKGEVLLEQRAVVIENGPLVGITEGQPRAVPGERVLIAAYSGYAMKGPADGRCIASSTSGTSSPSSTPTRRRPHERHRANCP